ncbi:hypothetical protein CRUP_000890 [Coryphaenoides rupestris]|nr:hypothetical protein CRUP_000890 [Coryphaenoides rupestris]
MNKRCYRIPLDRPPLGGNQETGPVLREPVPGGRCRTVIDQRPTTTYIIYYVAPCAADGGHVTTTRRKGARNEPRAAAGELGNTRAKETTGGGGGGGGDGGERRRRRQIISVACPGVCPGVAAACDPRREEELDGWTLRRRMRGRGRDGGMEGGRGRGEEWGGGVDGVKQCCLVRFEDNSEFWVLRKDIHSCYHPECHTPAIEPEADSDSWICRQCVFAVATKRGGALKRGRFARLMQFMKLRLPYQLPSLDWDPQHLTNQQQWNLKMLQCGGCGQWFHEACTQCLSKPLLYGDRVDLAHLVLYHLSLCCKRKYFDFDHEIMSFTNENWESLLLGTVLLLPSS